MQAKQPRIAPPKITSRTSTKHMTFHGWPHTRIVHYFFHFHRSIIQIECITPYGHMILRVLPYATTLTCLIHFTSSKWKIIILKFYLQTIIKCPCWYRSLDWHVTYNTVQIQWNGMKVRNKKLLTLQHFTNITFFSISSIFNSDHSCTDSHVFFGGVPHRPQRTSGF